MSLAFSSFGLDKVATPMAMSPHRSFVLSSKTPYHPEFETILLFLSPTLELPDLANKIIGCPVTLEFQTNNRYFFSMSHTTLPCSDSVGSFKDRCH